jgi:ATP-dependent DNA helicase RecQ
LKSVQNILKQYWGYDAFRPQQLAIIQDVLEGKDVLTLLPTGAGKSLCFQVPTLYQNGICVVISPLIALMQDQVKDLQQKNINAIALGGQITEDVQNEILTDAIALKYQFIYCSPEKLAQQKFQDFLKQIPVTLFAIDEAHCISQWGYDFRPSYRKVSVLKKLFPKIPILAMTASAIPVVQKDILTQLSIPTAQVITDRFLRPNLQYIVQQVPVKLHTLRGILNATQGSIIIYCNTRNNVTQLATLLKAYGYRVGEYHAGLTIQNRQAVQKNWMSNITPIVVCTNAFGMGINKGNVRLVVHYDLPNSLEQYYQEAGRAGRDGQAAQAIMLYQKNDWEYWMQVQEKKYPSIDIIKKVYQDVADYVQLPVGMGEKKQFLFDFEQFCVRFEWDKMIARNALAWIQQEGHLIFSEASFKPSMVQVITDRESIEAFEHAHPIPGFVLQTILRTYGGILDSPHYINESLLAELLQRDIPFVIKQLHFLQLHGQISFEQKEQQPVVSFLWNRTSAAFMKLDLDHYTLMKKAFLERIRHFSTYVKGIGYNCRSNYLAKYFGENNPIQCEICDLCTSTKD